MSAPVHEGDVLAGKYRVERVLGEGGMGVVVAARHIQLEERVALKFLLADALKSPEAIARFQREARAAVRIKSEHVARVSDVGTLDNGAPYMVMEYLEGSDLAAWLQQRGAMPVEQAVEFVLQACEAIAEAHALGIVHRDLKPANLFCIRRSDGLLSIKVLDFGISKVTLPSGSSPSFDMTRTQAAMGSPLYMSPEQMRSSKDVDGRTDIWAIGVILFEVLTGHVPFTGESMPDLAINVVATPAPSPRSLRPDLPEGLAKVILRCLEKDRANRFADVAELAVALGDFAPKRARGSIERTLRVIEAAGLSTGARASLNPSTPPPAAAAAATADPRGGTVGAWGQTGSSSGRGRAFAGAGVVVLAVACAAGIIAFVRRPLHAPATAVAAAAPPSPAPGSSASAVLVAEAVPDPSAAPSSQPSAAPPLDDTVASAGASTTAAPAPVPVVPTGATGVPVPRSRPTPAPAPKPSAPPKSNAFDDRK